MDEDETIYFLQELRKDAVPTENLPAFPDNLESICVMKHDLKSSASLKSPEDSPSASATTVRKEGSIQPKYSIAEQYKHNRYDMIRTRAQLDDLKEANERLQKQLAEMEKDLANQTSVYRETLRENTDVRYNLKKYAKHVFSKQRTKAILSKVFSQTQIKVLMGKKKTYWSDHDMAVAYTIRHLSNISCYNYLMKNMNIPLPGLSSIKRWINVKNLGKKKPKKQKNQSVSDTVKSEENDVVLEESEIIIEEHEAVGKETEEITEEHEEMVEDFD